MKNFLSHLLTLCLIAMLAVSCRDHKNKQTTAGTGTTDTAYFRFDGFGTRMAIPEEWKTATSISRNPAAGDGAAAEYDIVFTGKDGKESEFLGAIFIFTPALWEAVPEEWRGIYAKVGEIGGNSYFYRSNQSNPYDPAAAVAREYDAHFIRMPDAPRSIVISKDPAAN